MDTLVRIYGVLKEPITALGPWWKLWPLIVVEREKSMKFSVTHNTNAELFPLINDIMNKVIQEKGISVVKDEGRSAKQVDNLEFWPMDNFRYVAVETRLLSATPNTGAIQ
jgi:hypothetical protein